MNETSGVCTIVDCEPEPTDLLADIIKRLGPNQVVFLNLATFDDECGILNRWIVYRGIVEDKKTGYNVLFATERNSRNYENMKMNPKVAVSFLFPEVINSEGISEVWQVRLFDAEAVECTEQEIASIWSTDPLYCKIRSHISQCGKPVEHQELIARHDRLYENYKCGNFKLDQTRTFTAFKVSGKRWDFYMSQRCKIGDRVQYRRKSLDRNEKWQIMHVEP